MQSNNDVGSKLKYWREKKRFLSIRGLSLATGVKTTTISEIERGKRLPRHTTIEKLCKGLNITLDQLADTEIPDVFPKSRVA